MALFWRSGKDDAVGTPGVRRLRHQAMRIRVESRQKIAKHVGSATSVVMREVLGGKVVCIGRKQPGIDGG